MLTLLAVGCAILYLAWWLKEGQKSRAVQRQLRRQLLRQECERVGHVVERIHAWDDPRHPVDRCTRCERQWPVQYPCPHCGEELGTHGYRTS